MGDPRHLASQIHDDPRLAKLKPRHAAVLVAMDRSFSEQVCLVLEQDERFFVCARPADAAEAVHAAIDLQPDIALISTDLVGGGIAGAREILARLPLVTLVMVAEGDADLFPALRAGVGGYLLRDMNLERLPHTLWEAITGQSVAMPRCLMRAVLERFRDPAALRRSLASTNEEALTSREWQILSLLREGLSTAQISQRLSISGATVRSHRRRIRRKLQKGDSATSKPVKNLVRPTRGDAWSDARSTSRSR